MIHSVIITAAISLIFSMNFDDGPIPGVKGNAAFFDGINSRIVIPADHVSVPNNSFTIDCWVCPVAFPKSPCPIVCRQNDNVPGGFSLYLDARGRVHFRVAAAGEWISADSEEALDLREWSRITCCFNAGNSISVAVNGHELASTKMELPSVMMQDWYMWIGRTKVKTPSYYENKDIPIYSSFDGAIDELSVIDGHYAYKNILEDEFKRPEAPLFEKRLLPSGPEGDLAFGSWYIPLKYYEAWDNQWRGESPDIVVGFGPEIPYRVVFWRGISYAPCFVTEKGNWMCNEFIERSKVTGWGCPESMSDKHADFSSIKILENTAARSVVLWRNAPVGVNQKFPYQSEESNWGDWSEETYVFYPDGVVVRKMNVWSSDLTFWYEWCQSLQILHPGQRPEDVLNADKIMSVSSMNGRSETYGWNFDTKATQHEPSIPGANIQVTYLNSKWNPFLILDDRDGLNENGHNGPEISRYAGHWSEYSAFPWRNHWPVTQEYVIGRYAAVADSPAHTYTATQYCAPYKVEGNKMTKVMLCGCTDKDSQDLLPLAKSWLRAPEIRYHDEVLSYLFEERAYKVRAEGKNTIKLEVMATKEQPAQGLCLLIEGWKDSINSVSVNGKKLPDASYSSGLNVSYCGKTLVVWLDVSLDSRSTITLM